MAYQNAEQIAATVLNEGLSSAVANLSSENEIACANLVEDIRVWDSEPEHRTGTEGDFRTSQDLLDRLGGLSVQPKITELPFDKRTPLNCHVQTSTRRFDGIPLFDGGETDGAIQGQLAEINNKGDIALGFVNSGGAGREANQLLSQRADSTHKALIGISRHPLPGIAMLNADAYTQPFGLPVLIVDGSSEQALTASARASENVELNVQFVEKSVSASNIELRIQGTKPDLEPLVVMTPKSSWWTSTAERCGGIACWLACARDLDKVRPKRTVVFTANTGHELGHLGLDAFLEAHPGLAENAFAWVHFGANFASTDAQFRIQYSNNFLGSLMHKQLAKHEVEINAEVDGATRPGGEARNIYDAGGNYVSFLGSNRLFHHPNDRLATNVDFSKAMRTRNAAVAMVRELAESSA